MIIIYDEVILVDHSYSIAFDLASTVISFFSKYCKKDDDEDSGDVWCSTSKEWLKNWKFAVSYAFYLPIVKMII